MSHLRDLKLWPDVVVIFLLMMRSYSRDLNSGNAQTDLCFRKIIIE